MTEQPVKIHRRFRWRRIILTALLILTILSFFAPGIWGQIGSSIMLFLLACWLEVCLLHWKYRGRYYIPLILFFFLSIFGIIVYRLEISNAGDIDGLSIVLIPVNNMLATFFPSRGDYECNSHLWYQIYHSCVYFFWGWVLAALWGHRLYNFLCRSITPAGKTIIFWSHRDIPEICLDLAGKYCSRGAMTGRGNDDLHPLFLLDSTGVDTALLKHYYEKINEKNFLLDEFAPDMPPINRYREAPVHFFITEDCDWNIQMAGQISAAAGTSRETGGEPVKIFLRIGNSDSAEMFAARTENNKNIEVILWREYALAAQTLIAEYPMLTAPGIQVRGLAGGQNAVSGNFRLLLLGFGRLGREILRQCVCSAQFIGTTFAADIVEPDSEKFERFREQCRLAVQKYGLQFYGEHVRSGEFVRWLKDGQPGRRDFSEYNRIVICFNDVRLNIETAMFLEKIARERGLAADWSRRLFVYCPEPSLTAGGENKFRCFGSRNSLFDLIMTDRIKDTAKMMNYYWSWGRTENRDEAWRSANPFAKESSRASAVGSRNLLRLIYGNEHVEAALPEIDRNGRRFEELFPDFLERIRTSLRYLAETEHLRWNAWHLMQGIQPLPIAELKKIPPADGKIRANHIKDRNAHAALVSFDELPAVDAAIQGGAPADWQMLGLQKNDLNFLVYLPAIMEPDNRRRQEILSSLYRKFRENYFPELNAHIEEYLKDCREKIASISENDVRDKSAARSFSEKILTTDGDCNR